MTSWRMDLAVLTDLSASMFVACFMILLIFLSLVQAQAPASEGARAPVEAMQAFHVVRRGVSTPAAMVDDLYGHRHAAAGASVDLFAGRAVVAVPGTAETVTAEAADGLRGLAEALAVAPPGRLRLFVFSNEAYLPAVAILAASGRGWSELSVPQALRDRDRPEQDWSAAFGTLEASAGDARSFRAGLAALLDGGAGQRHGASPPASAASDSTPPAGSGLMRRMREWLSRLAALAAPVFAVLAVLAIERRRLPLLRGRARVNRRREQHS